MTSIIGSLVSCAQKYRKGTDLSSYSVNTFKKKGRSNDFKIVTATLPCNLCCGLEMISTYSAHCFCPVKKLATSIPADWP